jgi:hypothetical protein
MPAGMGLMQRVWPKRTFRLPPFELTALEFELEQDEEPLLLDEIAAEVGAQAPAIRLVHPSPSAGELHKSIERHLSGSNGDHRRVDTAEELRDALAELRQSLA